LPFFLLVRNGVEIQEIAAGFVVDILADVPVAERLSLATHNPIKAQRATYKTSKLFFKNKICLQLDLCLQRSSCWSYFWVRRAECLNRMSNCSNARIHW
jgi:hypothetical protein